jgi:hypothetical protein
MAKTHGFAVLGQEVREHKDLRGDRVRSARQGRHAEREAMITPSRDLSVTRQAKVLGISRGAVY